MKKFSSIPHIRVFLALVATSALVLLHAQQPAASAATAQVKIKNMPKADKVTMQTPEFQVRGGTPQALTRRPREWAVIDVTYETKSQTKWIDNVTATFYVLTDGVTPDKKRELSFYTKSVRYVNVPDGDHRASVVLAPSTLERYGKVVAIACEITADGALLPDVKTEFTTSDLNAFKDDWWKNPQVLDAPITKKRDGFLLERSETPFGLINIDDYEVVK